MHVLNKEGQSSIAIVHLGHVVIMTVTISTVISIVFTIVIDMVSLLVVDIRRHMTMTITIITNNPTITCM